MLNGRAEERRAFVAEVDVLHAGRPAPRRLWGKNLSEKGMFLQVTHGFRVGQRLSLRFDLGGNEIHIPSAEVVWIRGANEGPLEPGAGLRFEDLRPSDRERMRTYILQTDVDSELPGALLPSDKPVAISKITDVPSPRAGFAASLLPLKTPRPVTLRPGHRSVVQNLTHAVTLLRRGPVLSTPPVKRGLHSFIEPRESELRGANAVEEDSLARFDTSIEKDQLFSDESPSLYEQETAILKKQNLSGALTFDDHEPGLRALDGHEQNTKNERRKDSVAEEPAFLHYAKELKKEQKFEKGNLAAVDLPDAPPRQAIYRRQKRTSPAIYFAFFALMAGVGFFLLWRPSPDTVYQFETPSGNAQKSRLVLEAPSPTKAVVQDMPEGDEHETAGATPPAGKPLPKPSKPESVSMLPSPKTAKPAEKAAPSSKKAVAFPVEKISGKQFYSPTIETEYGRLHLGIRGGKVVRKFGLIRPARVVVDLKGAQHPGNVTYGVGQHGIKKIRIGRPDGQLVRIVILTEGDRRPQAISTLKRQEKLSVAWK